MTLKQLNQYRSICKEIDEINMDIKSNMVHSTVRGSDAVFPYLEHTVNVSGVEHSEDDVALLEKVRKLKEEKEVIEDYIDSIEDSLTRRIFTFRFIKGFSWTKTAIMIGGYNTAGSVKMECYRYIHSAE